MSQGLGQILGSNFKPVGAKSAQSIFHHPLDEQELYVICFLSRRKDLARIVTKENSSKNNFKIVAKYYNGSGYAAHHYDEGLAR